VTKTVNKTIAIHAPVSKVWSALTNPELMKQWVSEGHININSDWKEGSSITFSGNWHGIDYDDKGTILKFEKEKIFQYTYWSKFTRLTDSPENYTVVEFDLIPAENQTILLLNVDNIANDAMYGHIKFYWGTTLELLKKIIESK
jgi:uncharacterized protein YndB with AHSA1/START domain